MTSATATDARIDTPERPREELRYRSSTLTAFEENPLATKTMATRLPQPARKAIALARGRAVLLVTHRITDVAVVGRTVVPDEGRIVQEGTYAQLSQQPGLLRQLLSYQLPSEPDGEKRETPG